LLGPSVDLQNMNNDILTVLKGFYGMYNPYSLLLTFASVELGYYWFKTGTSTFLVRMLKDLVKTGAEFFKT